MKHVFLLIATASVAIAAGADGTQVDGIGSPDWFSWVDFMKGWACGWAVVGPMFIYWIMKRTTNEALG